ncbi:hypothetical protein [Virgibacillus sp. LDC-1]|uniref:hypothetical protein n=1 Tax=Virgibacillus sp. LDC-1 TaxID=3039856 RepID=UPI0024DE6232|nr:hypothetical protein [Virgibacillus sp. LDC-1]
MNIEANKEQFLKEISSLKQDLKSTLITINFEKYREDYKGRYSLERFREYFAEKTAIHTVFKYLLIRLIEESMARVKAKLNEEGLKNWHQMSKNFRHDYNVLFDLAESDVKRESDLTEIFQESIYDEEQFVSKAKIVLTRYIPILAKYDFHSLDSNTTLSIIDYLYSTESRNELQNFYKPSRITNFLLQQVGLL